MPYTERVIVRIIKNYCQQRGIKVEQRLDGWLVVLHGAGFKHFIYGYDIGLNSAVVHRIANDKAATAELLSAEGVACVPHTLVMNPKQFKYTPTAGHWAPMLALLAAHPEGLVLKPNEGTCGYLVAKATSELELEQAASAILAVQQNLAIAPFLEIEREVRVVLLDRQPQVVYEKMRPTIAGDGERTILELLRAKLPPGRLGNLLPSLAQSGTALGSVLPQGQKLVLDWRHNLDLGAQPELLSDGPVRAASVELASRAAAAIGLRFGAVDVIFEQGAPRILEINSGVMMETLHSRYPAIVEAAYSAALDQVLAASARAN
jgi:D-alanine-D-alanine ligase-like ATP-grasp enzyme